MADTKNPSGPQEDNFPPPPPGPPPGNNGLSMNPSDQQSQEPHTQQPKPDSHSELYDYPPPAQPPPSAYAQNQQTPHQPPPVDSNGAPKKAGWGQRFTSLGKQAAAPFNMLANKLGAETFLPSTMDKEVEKAARILKAFCTDGIYTDAAAPETVAAPTTDADGKPTTVAAKPKKNRTLLHIPSKVINRAVGLAIFTTARAGFHVSGATGSGVLVARLPDGSWSPPTGIQVHSVGAGFMIGIDIYDCVVVINTKEALAAFTKTRMSLGSDLAVVAGPWGAGGSMDFAAPQSKGKGKGQSEVEPDAEGQADKTAEGLSTTPLETDGKTMPPVDEKADKAGDASTSPTADSAERPAAGKQRKGASFLSTIKGPTYSYVKSRGFYAGVQVDGTIVTERKEANAAFYGEPVAVQRIVEGDVPLVPGKENWVNIVKPLWDTIRGAEGWHAQQGEWRNELGPDSLAGGSAGYPTAFDPVSEAAPAKPPRPTGNSTEYSTGASVPTAGVAAMNLGSGSEETPGARAKAAEAAAEAEMAREREERERTEAARDTLGTAPPGYSEMAGPGEGAGEQQPPAYVDDGTPKPGVGDTKGGPTSS